MPISLLLYPANPWETCAFLLLALVGCVLGWKLTQSWSKLSATVELSPLQVIVHRNQHLLILAILLLVPLEVVSSYRGRWSFGYWLCQLRAFYAMLVGLVFLLNACLACWFNWLESSGKFNSAPERGKQFVRLSTLLIWLFAGFWSILPLFGIGSYGLDSPSSSCMLIVSPNSSKVDVAYLALITMLAFFLPTATAIISLWKPRRCRLERRGYDDDNELKVKCRTVWKLNLRLLVSSIASLLPYAVLSTCRLLLSASNGNGETMDPVLPEFGDLQIELWVKAIFLIWTPLFVYWPWLCARAVANDEKKVHVE